MLLQIAFFVVCKDRYGAAARANTRVGSITENVMDPVSQGRRRPPSPKQRRSERRVATVKAWYGNALGGMAP